jgi:hypothetical protein
LTGTPPSPPIASTAIFMDRPPGGAGGIERRSQAPSVDTTSRPL